MALPTNPPECSRRVWCRNGREGCSGMLYDVITHIVYCTRVRSILFPISFVLWSKPAKLKLFTRLSFLTVSHSLSAPASKSDFSCSLMIPFLFFTNSIKVLCLMGRLHSSVFVCFVFCREVNWRMLSCSLCSSKTNFMQRSVDVFWTLILPFTWSWPDVYCRATQWHF